jgi:hypothetical protein
VFTRAAMVAVDKLDYLINDIQSEEKWKTVPNILDLFLNEKVKYIVNECEEESTGAE